VEGQAISKDTLAERIDFAAGDVRVHPVAAKAGDDRRMIANKNNGRAFLMVLLLGGYVSIIDPFPLPLLALSGYAMSPSPPWRPTL
jgi:hypothetical protein